MGSSSETITSFDAVRIMKDGTLGKVFDGYILNAGKNMPIGFDVVRDTFGRSIVDVNSLYNERYMQAMGYDTVETVEIYDLSEDALLQWMRDNVNSSISSISNYEEGLISLTEVALKDLEETYADFNIASKRLTAEDGKQYKYMTEVSNGPMYDIVLYMDGKDCIDTYAIANGYTVVTYPSSYTVVDGVYFWVAVLLKGSITSTVSVPFIYKYISKVDSIRAECERIAEKYTGHITTIYSEPDSEGYYHSEGEAKVTVTYLEGFEFKIESEAIYGSTRSNEDGSIPPGIQAVYANEEQVRVLIQKEIISMQVIKLYYRLNGETHFYYNFSSFIGDKVKTKKRATTLPMIPFKERFSFVSSPKLSSILNKIGMKSKDFTESLNDSKIASAYLMFGIPFDHTHPAAVRYIFETLKVLVAGGGGYNSVGSKIDRLRRKDISLKYTNMASIETNASTISSLETGSIGPIGTVTREEITYEVEVWEEGYSYMEPRRGLSFKKQETEDSFFEITLSAASTTYLFGNMDLRPAELGNPKCVLPIIREVFMELSFEDKCYLLEIGMHLLVFTQQEVKTKWYQSGFFQFLMLAVVVVASVFTGGAAAAAYGAAASAAAAAGAAVTVGMVVAAAGVVAAVVSAVMAFAAFMGADFGSLGAVIGIALAAFGGYSALTNTTLSTANTALAVASSSVSIVSTVNSVMIQKDIKGLMAEANKAVENNKEAQKALATLEEGLKNALVTPFVNRHDEINLYYDIAVGGQQCNYDVLYDFTNAYTQNIITV